MSRYFTQPSRFRATDDEWWSEPFINVPTVCEHEAVYTGLINQHGDCIMRAPNPCGFGRDEEW